MRAFAAVLALACALLSGPSYAQTYPFLDGNSRLQQMCTRPQGTAQVPCSAQVWIGWAPSGLTPITGTLSATGSTANLLPIAGRPFSGSLTITGVATVQLEREAPGDGTFYPLATDAGLQKYAWSTTGSQSVSATVTSTEPMPGSAYRWRVTACSGCSVAYRLEQ